MVEKEQARKIVSDIRKTLSSDNVDTMSALIFNRLQSIEEFINARTIFLYSPIRNEADTVLIQKFAFERNIKLAYPKVTGNEMLFYEVNTPHDLTKGYMNILEPVNGLKICNDESGVIIVPGNAFDSKCNRIGYGKGFYDRYLSKYNKLTKIGICFGFQLFDDLCTNEFDISMDYVITENLTIKKEII